MKSLSAVRLFRPYEGHDTIGSVISMNLHRRHLTDSQRAAVAAKLANLKDGQRADHTAQIAHLSRKTMQPKC